MSVTRIEGLATALSPVVHGGDRVGGTLTEFRREKAVVDGRVEMLPAISGNSVRGQLRDLAAEFSLQAAGLSSLKNLRSFSLLFQGGSLTKADNASYIAVEEERRLRELLPAVSLLGGSVGNRILGGKLDCGEWVPLCREWRFRIPPDYEVPDVSVYDLLDVLSFTRRDDSRSRHQQRFLDPDALHTEELRKEAQALSGEAEEAGVASQMRYSYEVMVPGTQFYVRFALHDPTEVELGTFLGALALFATKGRIGGRASSGMGEFRLDLKQLTLKEPVAITGDLAVGKIELAEKHIAECKDDMLALLEAIYG